MAGNFSSGAGQSLSAPANWERTRTAMISLRRMALFLAVALPCLQAACGQDKPAPTVKMARDADPDFEVATIKPADPDDHHQGFSLNGRRVTISNNTMTNLICFAYSIHKSQIINAPHWFDEQRWN